jgi:hypothetical protein
LGPTVGTPAAGMISPVPRVPIIASVVSINVVFAIGCGGSATAPSDHLLPLTAGQVGYANATNLREADVRGLPDLQQKIDKHALGRLGAAEWRRCGGIKITAAAGSPKFSEGVNKGKDGILSLLPTEGVQSFVYFTPSPATALAALKAGASTPTRRCAIDTEARSLRYAPFAHYGRVSSLPSRLAGVPMVGQQVITPGLFGDEATFKERWFGFTVGSVIVVLEDYGEPKPLPSTTERRLLGLLYNRANAHTT